MSQTIRPLARQKELVVQFAGDEVLVFDKHTDKAYVLSPAAAAVWRASNGTRTVKEIAESLSQETPMNEQTVWYALGQMQELLEEPVQIPRDLQGISRRKFLQRAGLVAAAAAVPVVISMVVPTAAHAQSAAFYCCLCDEVGVSFVLDSCDSCPSQCAGAGGQYDCLVLGPGAVCS